LVQAASSLKISDDGHALFVPWLYMQAASGRRRGSDIDTAIRRLLIQLAIRLKSLGGEPYDVIGGDKLGHWTCCPRFPEFTLY
jgi:hypothetical protein